MQYFPLLLWKTKLFKGNCLSCSLRLFVCVSVCTLLLIRIERGVWSFVVIAAHIVFMQDIVEDIWKGYVKRRRTIYFDNLGMLTLKKVFVC